VLTDEGVETFATNHLAGFLLMHLLLPMLRSSAPARVICGVVIGSCSGQDGDLTSVVTGAPLTPDSYQTSKLLNILFVRELTRHLEGTGVTANVADPGFVRTNLGRYAAGRHRVMLSLTRPIQSSPDQGAATPVYLATSAEVAGVTGGYYVDGHPRELSGLATNDKLARKLWGVSVQALVSRGLATLNEVITFGGT
jgi:NAD(P)-dependent dehydrogenase (short-subunit alcohol dehydrogenase family)